MSPPHRAGGLPYDANNSQNWFGTSLDSNASSFGQSPIFTGIVSPSASTGHLDNYTNDDEEIQQKNLQEIFEKRRRRRESHNAVERRRRDNINERIQELCTLLPERLIEAAPTSSNVMSVSNGQGGTNGRAINKGTILKLSVDHIKELREEVTRYQERIRELEQMIEAAKRGEMIKDDKLQQSTNCLYHNSQIPPNNINTANNNNNNNNNHNNNNQPPPSHHHQRMGSLQFRQQFNNLQIGSNNNNS
ncbi:Putative BHLH family transcription factor [Rhizopus microsporus]|nr:Putative BHLH family transcription factor [Rhizopus microsporus]